MDYSIEQGSFAAGKSESGRGRPPLSRPPSSHPPHRLTFERLLANLAVRFVNLPSADVERQIALDLEEVTKFFQVDGAAFYQYSADGRILTAIGIYQKEGTGAPPREFPVTEVFPWINRLVLSGGGFACSSREDLPPEAEKDRRNLETLGIQAFLTIPILGLGETDYVMSISSARDVAEWPGYYTTRLQLLGEMFVRAVQRRNSEREISTLREELHHFGRTSTLGELAASIAHEINQPLAAVLSNAQVARRLLKADPPDLKEVDQALADIIDDDRRAAEIIRRLRSFLRRGEREDSPLDLYPLIEEIAGLVRNEAATKHIRLDLEKIGNPPQVLGDRIQLQQVILNLLMNALEATEKGTEKPGRVRVRLEPEGKSHVAISVRDNGIGIEPANAEKAFEAFYTTKPNGLGMGLTISRSIVESHHGKLWSTANNGAGTTFFLRLPVR